MMQRVWASAVVAAVLAVLCHSAEAGPKRHAPAARNDDTRLIAGGIAAGAVGTAGYFALRDWRWRNPPNAKVSDGGALTITTIGCMALAPIISTVLVQRELTYREAYAMTADCIIPFIGGWLVNQAFDAHPEWEPRPVRHR